MKVEWKKRFNGEKWKKIRLLEDTIIHWIWKQEHMFYKKKIIKC